MSEKERANETYIVASQYQILNLLCNNPELIDVKPEINEDLFSHKQARDLYNAVFSLHKNKEKITSLSLLREANRINEEIDLALIEKILDFEVDTSSVQSVIESLKKDSVKYKLNRNIHSLTNELSKLGSINEEKVQSLLWDAQQIVLNGTSNVDSKTIPECLDNYILDLERRRKGEYFTFGDQFLDNNLTRKASGGQYILISAATGMGKSGYALNLIDGMINLGVPCMYFSLEMDEISTFDRLLAKRTKIPITDWYQKENIQSLILKVQKEKEILSNKPFRFIDNPNISLTKIQSLIREFKLFYKVEYVCVYIDLITQVKEFIDIDNSNLATAIEKAVNKLNAIAKEENVCFVCVAQMKRTIDDMKITKVEDTEKLKPTLGSIKNSGALAERARVVLGVFRARPYIEKYLPKDPKLEFMQDIMEVNILKQNQGGISQGMYLFDATIMTAIPYVEEESEIKF